MATLYKSQEKINSISVDEIKEKFDNTITEERIENQKLVDLM